MKTGIFNGSFWIKIDILWNLVDDGDDDDDDDDVDVDVATDLAPSTWISIII